jgi:hypothetical protein
MKVLLKSGIFGQIKFIMLLLWKFLFLIFVIFFFKMLGESLEDLHRHCNRQFSIVTVIQIAVQVITRLEALHKAGYVCLNIF